jgi:hypothetical protein
VHHFGVLAGYGAEAVHPYLAMETLAAIHKDLPGDLSAEKAIYNYVKAIGKGLSKIMSKMGVSTYMSYCGAQLFEAIGLNSDTIEQVLHRHRQPCRGHRRVRDRRRSDPHAPRCLQRRPGAGQHAGRRRRVRLAHRGEEHMWTPDAIAKLQHSTRANNWSTYKEYAQIINDQSRRHMTLRGLFEFKIDPAKAIPVDEVESAVDIVKRFATGAMSLGSISTEAHATLAVAMNRIGGKSNTGEGGEDPARYRNELKGIPIKQGDDAQESSARTNVEVDLPLQDGDSLRSRIKQVASGRFGVTAEYLSFGRPDPDQDGAGRQARRRRPAARRQGDRVHRQAALLGAGRGPHLAPAAPRHLLDRRPGAAHPRPEERGAACQHQRQAGERSRRGHHRRRRGQVQERPRGDRRPRRRHGRIALVVDQARRLAPGKSAWPRPSRPWCSTACAAASGCRPTAR